MLRYSKVNLLWNRGCWKIRKHRRNITSWNVSGLFRAFGKSILIDGAMCVWLRHKKMKRIGSSIHLRRYAGKDGFYYTYPLYFSIGYKFKVTGHSYANIVKCSRLVTARQKW